MVIIIPSTIIYDQYKQYFHHKWECSRISHVMSAALPLVTSVVPAGAAVLPTSMLDRPCGRTSLCWPWVFIINFKQSPHTSRQSLQNCHTERLEMGLPKLWIKLIEQVFLELFPWVETFSQHENDFDSHHSSSRESRSKRMMEAASLGSSKPPITERAAFPAWQGGMLVLCLT